MQVPSSLHSSECVWSDRARENRSFVSLWGQGIHFLCCSVDLTYFSASNRFKMTTNCQFRWSIFQSHHWTFAIDSNGCSLHAELSYCKKTHNEFHGSQFRIKKDQHSCLTGMGSSQAHWVNINTVRPFINDIMYHLACWLKYISYPNDQPIITMHLQNVCLAQMRNSFFIFINTVPSSSLSFHCSPLIWVQTQFQWL